MNGVVEEKLIEAQGYVKRGWTKHKPVTPKGHRVCAIGALNKAFGGDPHYAQTNWPAFNQSQRLLSAALAKTLGFTGPYNSIPYMNDLPGTTKEHVLEAFQNAIDAAHKQGI